MNIPQKRVLIGPDLEFSIQQQCQLLDLPRSSYYYEPLGESERNLKLMKAIDKIYTKKPYFGRPRITHHLRELGFEVNPKCVARLMQVMGIRALYPRPRTSIPINEHLNYPYLLRNLDINRPNQVWCSDITYIPMAKGFLYLVAIMDWYSRYVISWRISNSLDMSFCIEALEDALQQGHPEIFNTDKGGQYTSPDFTKLLLEKDVKISMTARGHWDNIMIERLWRSVKYECIYLNDYQDGRDLHTGIGQYLQEYNYENPHQALNMNKPHLVWTENL